MTTLRKYLDNSADGINFVDASSTPPPAPVSGTAFYNTDTNRVSVHDGTQWLDMESSGIITEDMLWERICDIEEGIYEL